MKVKSKFPSLKGFEFGLDRGLVLRPGLAGGEFPSLKGFEFGLDPWPGRTDPTPCRGFHPSKGSSSA